MGVFFLWAEEKRTFQNPSDSECFFVSCGLKKESIIIFFCIWQLFSKFTIFLVSLNPIILFSYSQISPVSTFPWAAPIWTFSQRTCKPCLCKVHWWTANSPLAVLFPKKNEDQFTKIIRTNRLYSWGWTIMKLQIVQKEMWTRCVYRDGKQLRNLGGLI